MLKKLLRHYFFISIFTSILLLSGCATQQPYNVRADQLPQVQQYINTMVTKHNFDRQQLNSLFSQITIHYEPIKKISKPYEAKPWYVYRKGLVTPQRIKDGVIYWNKHRAELAVAAKKHNVEPEIIVAIIGVETNYGTNKGKFNVFRALTTLAFAYPNRAPYFKSELTSFLLQTRKKGLDPLSFKGSYAGAFGISQFMPSSYGEYAVSYDGVSAPDIINNHKDAIISVANYFNKHGWTYHAPVTMPAIITNDDYQSLPQIGLKPKLTIAELSTYGIKPTHWVAAQTKAKLMLFQGEYNPEYWLGFNNFYVIQRYNSSANYAMAVYDLAQEIKQRVNSPSLKSELTHKK